MVDAVSSVWYLDAISFEYKMGQVTRVERDGDTRMIVTTA